MDTKRMAMRLTAALVLVLLVAGACAPAQATPTIAPATTAPEEATPTAEAMETAPAEETEAGESQTLRIGAALALTGAVSREGGFVRDGYDYWMEDVNSRGGIQVGNDTYTVEIVYYDDRSDPETASRLTERLITEDNVQFLLGPYSSGITINTSAVAERYGVLTMASNANSPSIYDRGYQYVFSILPPATKYLHFVLDMAAAQSPKPETMAIMVRDDPFGTAVAAGAESKAQELEMEVVFSEPYSPESTDHSSALTTIKGLDPDIVLASTLFADALQITRQAKELQVCPNILTFSVGPAIPDFPNELGEDANQIVGAEWWLPTLGWQGDVIGSAREFGEEFEAQFGYSPSYHSAAAVMAGLILEKAIARAGTLESDAVREEILKFDEEAFFGPIAWDESGQNIRGASVAVQIQEQEVKAVWPPQAAEVDPIYPFQCWTER